mmetsp:Transcript_15625/g.33218  ORF Transcript_15625/g.33218 Transcript_15625/m.33218 type:complete len:497 (-) Transcript_15625:258-1748(-)
MAFNEEHVLEQLESFDAKAKVVTLQNLALAGTENALLVADPMVKLFEDEEAEVRKQLCITLGKLGPAMKDYVKDISDALKDEDMGVRAEAARALGLIGRAGAGAQAAKVAELAKDSPEDTQVAAVQALAALGEAMRLGPFLQASKAPVIKIALVEVGRDEEACKKHAQLIMDRLSHTDTSVRLAAAEASGKVADSCTEAHIQALGKLRATEKNPRVRKSAVLALGRVGTAGVPALLNFFQDTDETVRHLASETLGVQVGGSEAAEGAAGLLQDPNPMVRQTALRALGKLGDDGLEQSAVIGASVINDTDLASRLAAIQALGELCASSEAETLGSLTEDQHKGVRQAAVTACSHMGAEGAVAAVLFLDDPHEAVRQAAIRVFSPLHSKMPAHFAFPHSEAIAQKLLDEDWRVRLAAVVCLGDLKASNHEELTALCKDENEQVRRSAVAALVKQEASAANVAAFLGDTDKGTRLEAERAYALLGGGAAGDDGELSEAD